MDDHNVQLGEIASEASLERTAFLGDAARQLERFLKRQQDRIHEVGGMVLIDEDPDYLSVAPDGSFRSRTRYQDEKTGEWVSETEVIESPSELIELYNPAELYAAFAEAAREAAGFAPEPTATEGLAEAAGLAPEERIGVPEDPYAEVADTWAKGRAGGEEPEDEPESVDEAAERLYDLALSFQERSQHQEAHLLEQFQDAAEPLARHLGDLLIIDDDDERLTLASSGQLKAEVVPEDEEGRWRSLGTPEELVQFYDPTDVFGDIAESIAEAYPTVAAEDSAGSGAPGEAGAHDGEAVDEDDDEDDGDDDEADDEAKGDDRD
ncbi:MAG: hypothetical protein ACRDGL_09595 [Candidatus Limnocylindrales bacterium]